MSDVDSTKCCSTCGIVQPLSSFHRHPGTKDGRRGNCESCASSYSKAYRAANAERLREYAKRYREANAAEISRKSREWYEANRDDVIARTRAYTELHPERYRQYMQKARKKHWLSRKLSEANRRAAKSCGSAPYDPCTDEQTLWELHEGQSGMCAYCEEPLFGEFHIDHMVPLSRGGTHDWLNFALACARCNLSKRNKTPEEFMDWRTKAAKK